MFRARPVMCAGSRNSMSPLNPLPRNRTSRWVTRALMISSVISVVYAVASATNGYSHGCSKPSTV
jgi:hypothetical protein